MQVLTNSGVHEKGTFNAQDAIDNIKKDPNYPKAGAIGLFIGVVRGETLESEKETLKGSQLKLTRKKLTKCSQR